MKTLIALLTASMVTVVFAAEDVKAEKNQEAKKPSIAQRVGGFLIDYKAAKGKYMFINCQDKLDTKLINGLAVGLKNDYSWLFECVDGEKSVRTVKEVVALKAKHGALAATAFVYCDDLPFALTVPEANLSIVNVKELMADNPKAILLENRLVRATLRAFAFSLGAGYTTFEAGVMQPIASVADLDRFSSNFIPPDTANAALQNGGKIGFKPYRRTTYKRACKEGWAPAPTNEFQKAVWDKVRATPKNPMKIEFDPKKGR